MAAGVTSLNAEMRAKLRSRSLKVFFVRLAFVLILYAIVLAFSVVFDWGGNARQAMLRNVDDGVALGHRAATAVGGYFLKQGRYPSSLDDLQVKIEHTSMANVTLSSQSGEVVITLLNKRFDIDGRRMYFVPEMSNGTIKRIACRTEDEEFRKRIDARCD